MRDTLENQIIVDANNGDTTVLASLLEMLNDKQIYNALGDEAQSKFDNPVDTTNLYVLTEDAINGTTINEKIRDEDLFEYYITDRKDFIDELIGWISEATNDKELMEQDLEILMNVEDDYILSSNSTNEYLYVGCAEFDNTCKELLELNDTLK